MVKLAGHRDGFRGWRSDNRDEGKVVGGRGFFEFRLTLLAVDRIPAFGPDSVCFDQRDFGRLKASITSESADEDRRVA